MERVAGTNGQVAPIGDTLPESIAVTVTGAEGRTLAGIAVAWAVASGGGSIAPTSSTTDAAGVAKAQWTMGPLPGPATATATVGSLAPVVFDAAAIGPDGEFTLRVVEIASGLSNPLYLTAPEGDPRLFIVEQSGRIRIVENGQLLPTPFLDITDRVKSGGEQGLLSVAFDPGYAANGLFFVDYTDLNGDTRVERYSVSPNPNVADRASAALVLAVPQPFSNHNGGLVVFGPDGMLYVGTGDGGGVGDPNRNGQNLGTLLGKLLRIDVSRLPYTVPPTNPFVGRAGARPEIWALGLRNPWRFSFDPITDQIYIADVGQESREEVDVAGASQGGLNYGWNAMEGTSCYASAECDKSGLTLPVLEYDHSQGCSITGGYVYAGTRMPELTGLYFYSDFCAGFLRSVRVNGSAASEQRDWGVSGLGNVLSFGRDATGELYVLSADGRVYRIDRG